MVIVYLTTLTLWATLPDTARMHMHAAKLSLMISQLVERA
jgi:hypothetical protein